MADSRDDRDELMNNVLVFSHACSLKLDFEQQTGSFIFEWKVCCAVELPEARDYARKNDFFFLKLYFTLQCLMEEIQWD